MLIDVRTPLRARRDLFQQIRFLISLHFWCKILPGPVLRKSICNQWSYKWMCRTRRWRINPSLLSSTPTTSLPVSRVPVMWVLRMEGIGNIHIWRPQNVMTVGPLPPCPHLVLIYSREFPQPLLLHLLLGSSLTLPIHIGGHTCLFPTKMIVQHAARKG